MSSCIPFNTGAHRDQRVCLNCGFRKISDDNINCPTCGPQIVMVNERAWAQHELWKRENVPHLAIPGALGPETEKTESEVPQVEAPTQLGLFGAA